MFIVRLILFLKIVIYDLSNCLICREQGCSETNFNMNMLLISELNLRLTGLLVAIVFRSLP